MEFINEIIYNHNIPLLSAFLFGVLSSISPCPLATNITAIAFISKNFQSPKKTVLSGLFYTLGRVFSYTLLAMLIYFGFSSFAIAGIFQGWGDKVLGPVLIFIGLVMFGFIKINLNLNNEKFEKVKLWLSEKGYFGSFALGVLFALAFCPYSGVLFFGVLIPMVLSLNYGLLLAPVFAFGTGLPVIIFSLIIAFSIQKLNKAYAFVQKIEKKIRYFIATVFVLSGIYYMQFLIKYLVNL